LSEKYITALLSNFGDSFDIFEEKWRTFDTIHPRNIFVSVRHKMRKPNREFYDLALKSLEIEPHEAIFIDDRQENIDAAKKIGMKGILFTDIISFKNQLAELVAND
jgi:FMN phosphatase YigB (HAD superfamily)